MRDDKPQCCAAYFGGHLLGNNQYLNQPGSVKYMHHCGEGAKNIYPNMPGILPEVQQIDLESEQQL